MEIIKFIGKCIINLIECLKIISKGNINAGHIIEKMAFIGFDSAPMALLIVFVTGAVMSLQLSNQFAMSGAEGYVGAVINYALLRELAPGFAAFAIGARAGTAMSAEIANMKITQQVDAINVLKVDPMEYLFVPRIIASTLVLPLITILAQLAGILGAALVAFFTIGMHFHRFFYSVWVYTEIKDIRIALIKAAIFGLIISIVCCTKGFDTKGGAKDVGVATTKAAMYTAVALLLADYFLSWLFFV